MPQSLAAAYVHLVFSTRDRAPFLQDQHVRNEMHAYLGGICLRTMGQPLGIGGTADHVHVLTMLPKALSIADLVRLLKSNSSSWASTRVPGFAWQAGYGAFTFARPDLAGLQHYVERQEEHHRTVTFQEEYRALLKEFGIEFDERYLWQ